MISWKTRRNLLVTSQHQLIFPTICDMGVREITGSARKETDLAEQKKNTFSTKYFFLILAMSGSGQFFLDLLRSTFQLALLFQKRFCFPDGVQDGCVVATTKIIPDLMHAERRQSTPEQHG